LLASARVGEDAAARAAWAVFGRRGNPTQAVQLLLARGEDETVSTRGTPQILIDGFTIVHATPILAKPAVTHGNLSRYAR
jgi:hypothetical protein